MPYCGACDGRLIFNGYDDRPVSRATCWSFCKHCWQKVPMCRSCAVKANKMIGCSKCGKPRPGFDFDASRAEFDPPHEDCGDYTDDVRTLCPRFTPAARTHLRLRDCWKQNISDGDKLRRWWHTKVRHRCTGCDIRTQFRSLWNVVLITDGKPESYKHKLCGACAFCIQERQMDILAATRGRQASCENGTSVEDCIFKQDYSLQTYTNTVDRLILRS